MEAENRPIAAAVFLTWNDTVIYKFGASDERSWALRPNHLLFWHAIRAACEQGRLWFDFGRTDIGHEGLRNFKLSWGAVEEPLLYETMGEATELAPSAEGMATRVLGPIIRNGPLLRAVPWAGRSTGMSPKVASRSRAQRDVGART